MKPMYAYDWHQCVRCGCTFHHQRLKKVRRIDSLLGIDELVHACLDEVRCASFKEHRNEALAHERASELLEIAATAIGKRRGGPKAVAT